MKPTGAIRECGNILEGRSRKATLRRWHLAHRKGRDGARLDVDRYARQARGTIINLNETDDANKADFTTVRCSAQRRGFNAISNGQRER